MIHSIWHLRGSTAITKQDDVVLDQIEALLKSQQKPIIDRGPDFLVFCDPSMRSMFKPTWLTLSIYEQGRFWIDRSTADPRLRYDLRRLYVVIICMIGAMLFSALGFVYKGFSGGVTYGLFALIWFYLFNIFFTLRRTHNAIRTAVEP